MLIHTIEIQGDIQVKGVVSATRKSETRRYLACIVATVTAATIRIRAEQKAKAEAELVDWSVKLVDRRAAHNGMTLEQATAWEKDASDKWYARGDTTRGFDVGYFGACKTVRAQHGGRGHLSQDRERELAAAIMVSQGFADPYDKSSPYGIMEAASAVESLERRLAGWQAPVLGAQGVVSWHGTVANAQKALSSGECRHIAERDGRALSVRTDITVRETAKRAAKAAL